MTKCTSPWAKGTTYDGKISGANNIEKGEAEFSSLWTNAEKGFGFHRAHGRPGRLRALLRDPTATASVASRRTSRWQFEVTQGAKGPQASRVRAL